MTDRNTIPPAAVDQCDWLVRTAAPAFLRVAGFDAGAAMFEKWPPLSQMDLESKRGIPGLIPHVSEVLTLVSNAHQIEREDVYVNRPLWVSDPGVHRDFPERSQEEHLRISLPGVMRNADVARWMFRNSRAGTFAHTTMILSLMLAFVRSDGVVTAEIRAANDAVMHDLIGRLGPMAPVTPDRAISRFRKAVHASRLTLTKAEKR